MYLVQLNIFQNLEDEDITESFEYLYEMDDITVKDMKNRFPDNIVEEIFEFGLVKNIANYKSFLTKPDSYEIKMNDGIYIENNHVYFSEEGIYSLIRPKFKFITLSKIKKSLYTLRDIMCLNSDSKHPLVHKSNEDYNLDDELYQILFFLGNPYSTLRLELLIEEIINRTQEIESTLDMYLKIFYKESITSQFIKKLEKANKISANCDYVDYIIKKSRNLPSKFTPTEETELYKEWRSKFNKLLEYKNTFIKINDDLAKIKDNYSGSNQKMSYLTFIERVSDNEEEITAGIKEDLLDIRYKLKEMKIELDSTSSKELKIINLDLEREIIENEEEEEKL